MLQQFLDHTREFVQRVMANASRRFNYFSLRTKRLSLVLFGSVMATACALLIIQALFMKENTHGIRIGSIITVTNTFIDPDTDEDPLFPIGIPKCEINGEFEVFYLPVDRRGHLYINDSLPHGSRAYEKSEAWKAITREELKGYNQTLHFISFKGNPSKR